MKTDQRATRLRPERSKKPPKVDVDRRSKHARTFIFKPAEDGSEPRLLRFSFTKRRPWTCRSERRAANRRARAARKANR